MSILNTEEEVKDCLKSLDILEDSACELEGISNLINVLSLSVQPKIREDIRDEQNLTPESIDGSFLCISKALCRIAGELNNLAQRGVC